jgi:hypothetical protein
VTFNGPSMRGNGAPTLVAVLGVGDWIAISGTP